MKAMELVHDVTVDVAGCRLLCVGGMNAVRQLCGDLTHQNARCSGINFPACCSEVWPPCAGRVRGYG